MEVKQPNVRTLNLTSVFSKSKRIILAKYSHFLTLSLLFLPLSFTLITSPTLHRLHDQPFTHDHSNNPKLLISHLIYTLIVQVLALCAIGTVTYSTHHAFFGSPVKFSDTLKSLTSSFFRLASTAIITLVLIVLISLSFLMLVGAMLMLVHNLWFVIDYNSVYFIGFSAIMGLILIAIIVYFRVEWSLAFVVVVVESKWGFAALKRSSYLVKGMRSVSLLLMLYVGACGAFIVLMCLGSLDVENSWPFDVVIIEMFGSFFLMMFLLQITSANTVLYNYCKALHGELTIEGFDHDYVNVPSDDAKVPRVVTVVAALSYDQQSSLTVSFVA